MRGKKRLLFVAFGLLFFQFSITAAGNASRFENNQGFLSIYENTVGKVTNIGIHTAANVYLDSRGNRILDIRIKASNQSVQVIELILKYPLDREKQEIYNFTFISRSSVQQQLVQEVKNYTLQVLDLNDNVPMANNTVIDVECYQINNTIVRINGTDPDKGVNGSILYEITTVNGKQQGKSPLFAVINHGAVVARRHLESHTKYILNVTLKDRGLTPLCSYVIITINVVVTQMFNKTVQQWSPKDTELTGEIRNSSMNCSLKTVKETSGQVITAEQNASRLRVNRLVKEPPNSSFCLAVKVFCPGFNQSHLAYHITVVPNTDHILFATISFSYKSQLPTQEKIDLEMKTDSCIGNVSGGSRFEHYESLSGTLSLLRTYYKAEDYSKIESSLVKTKCLRNTTGMDIIEITKYGVQPTTNIPSTKNSRNQESYTSFPTTINTTTTPIPTTTTPIPTTTRPIPTTTRPIPTTGHTKPPDEINQTRTENPHTTVTEESKKDTVSTKIILGVLLGTAVFVLIALVIVYAIRRRIRATPPHESTQMSQINGSKTSWREINKAFIATGKMLGSGFFGVVYQGTVIMDGQSIQCAVKTLKENATETDHRDLLNELDISALLGYHPNIINLIGACTLSDPPLILLEFAANGNLLDYLQRHRSSTYTNMDQVRPDIDLDYTQRLKIAYEVAKGMRHLSSKKCVHRDLAARNVLLDEHFVAKITDFGLSRDVYEEGVYQINAQTKMPLKWMAIESLESMEFTTHSDVWSFGILMWEIETGGATPYPGQVGRELFQDLITGYRLEKPKTCPNELYEIMSRCWSREPQSRPSFQELCIQVGELLQSEAGYEDLLVTMETDENDISTHL